MNLTRKKILYITVGGVILLIYGIVIIAFITSSGKPARSLPSSSRNSATPTPVKVVLPTPLPPLDKAQNRAKIGSPLTANEQLIRTNMINSADKFGYIHTETTFSIVYLKSYDTFQIRLLSTNLSLAKQNSLSWLGTKGLSHNGICKLPIIFYVNPHLSSSPAASLSTLDSDYCQ